MIAQTEVAILDRDYADRQLIFVTSDLMARAAREEIPKSPFDGMKGEWKSARQNAVEKDWMGAAVAILKLYGQAARAHS
jgi:hypothetical protein